MTEVIRALASCPGGTAKSSLAPWNQAGRGVLPHAASLALGSFSSPFSQCSSSCKRIYNTLYSFVWVLNSDK